MMNSFHLLENLQGKRLNGYTLHLDKFRQLPLSGWREFALYLYNSHDMQSEYPVIRGIYSVGGKDGVKPWMDVVYSEIATFSVSEKFKNNIFLHSENLDRKLFQYLGEIIPPGGHIMVSYEEEEKIHSDTMHSLNIGIPPVATPLGLLIFLAGFQYVKDWYLSEGGFEGPRKLWGEKSLNETVAQTFYQKTFHQISTFLERKPSSTHQELEVAAKERAKEIVEVIKRKPGSNRCKGELPQKE